MKKVLLLFFIFMFLGIMISCESSQNNTTEELSSDERLIKIEQVYQDFISQVPESIDDDFLFPVMIDSDVMIEIIVDNNLLDDGLYRYEALAYDKEVVFLVRLDYQDLVVEKVDSLTQVKDQSLVVDEAINATFNIIFDEIRANIPAVMVSDITLPIVDREDAFVTYESPELEIYRNRLLFSFPENSEYVILSVAVAYASEVRSIDIPIRLEAENLLPKIPEIHINTDGDSLIDSDENYTQGTVDLMTNGMYQDVQEDFSNVRMGIRLRGNSTLSMPKKSYKIKFDQKREMFTDYAEKDWVLLANYADQSLIRTYLANRLSDELNMEFTPIYIFVDVYINGEYQGNYMLTDQVEATNDRVNIEEGSTDLNTGYLLEWDNRLYDDTLDHSNVNFFFIRGLPFVIKTPDWDNPEYSINQYYFIEDYMLTVYLTLQEGDDYSSIIDESSFIDWFIVNELFKNVDAGFSSIYFYKDRDELLKMGPVWDFDLSLGNAGHLEEELRTPQGWYTSREEKNKLFYFLMQYPEFRINLIARWNEVYEDHILPLLDEIHLITDSMAASIHQNFMRWDVIGKNDEWYTVPEILENDTYAKQVWFVYDYLEARIAWLNETINQLNDD